MWIFRKLNAIIKTNAELQLQIDTLLDKLTKAKIFFISRLGEWILTYAYPPKRLRKNEFCHYLWPM